MREWADSRIRSVDPISRSPIPEVGLVLGNEQASSRTMYQLLHILRIDDLRDSAIETPPKADSPKNQQFSVLYEALEREPSPSGCVQSRSAISGSLAYSRYFRAHQHTATAPFSRRKQ